MVISFRPSVNLRHTSGRCKCHPFTQEYNISQARRSYDQWKWQPVNFIELAPELWTWDMFNQWLWPWHIPHGILSHIGYWLGKPGHDWFVSKLTWKWKHFVSDLSVMLYSFHNALGCLVQHMAWILFLVFDLQVDVTFVQLGRPSRTCCFPQCYLISYDSFFLKHLVRSSVLLCGDSFLWWKNPQMDFLSHSHYETWSKKRNCGNCTLSVLFVARD